MSNLYNLEPQPTGKVVLHTTSGDISFELFAKQIPLASRNFLQHCLDGYYNDTIFHRIVPGFILQGGDPTSTGFGGESTFENGAPFADEFHSRLKFNRRGLLGMANSGDKNDNGSQFFITLGNTPELTGKNTMFGRIEDDTIFNVVKMADAELLPDGSERPMYPTRITGAEILLNPFEDMVKREKVAQRSTETGATSTKKKVKRKVGKALLSFGDDGAEEPDAPVVKKPKFNSKLVDGTIPATTTPVDKAPEPKIRQEQIKDKVSVVPALSAKPIAPVANIKPARRTLSVSSSGSQSPTPPPKHRDQLSKANDEIAALKASLRRNGPTTSVSREKPTSALEAMIPETSTRGRKRGAQSATAAQEASALALFKAFKGKLDAAEDVVETNGHNSKTSDVADQPQNHERMRDTGVDDDDDEEEATLCDLHFIANCQSCGNWDQADDGADVVDDDLFSHKLSFAKDRLGKDLEWKRKNEEELVVIDTREKARELGVAKVGLAHGAKGSGRQWDQRRDQKSFKSR